MSSVARIIIVGAGGRLGAALMREWRDKFDCAGFNHGQLDLKDPDIIRSVLKPLEFDCLVNCAAQTNVDRCETHREEAFLINAEAPRLLAEICRAKAVRMVHISTDYVFDGEKRTPYSEEDDARPISVYGESKREGEVGVTDTDPRHLVLRVSWVFGPDRPSFVDNMIERARTESQVAAIADKFSSPTYTKDIAVVLGHIVTADVAVAGVADPGAAVIDRGYKGILHFANSGECSWQEYAQYAIDCCHKFGVPLRAKTVEALKLADMQNFVARRPVYTVLSSSKLARASGTEPRHWRDAVAEYVREKYSKA